MIQHKMENIHHHEKELCSRSFEKSEKQKEEEDKNMEGGLITQLQNDNFKIWNKHSVILHMEKNAFTNETLILQLEWKKILKQFPGAFRIHKYGS